jgi:hypothetical protein
MQFTQILSRMKYKFTPLTNKNTMNLLNAM